MGVAVEFRRITKRFGEVVANSELNFRVERGTVHSLVGENGAGKTTAMCILAGLYRPDSGSILVEGEKVGKLSPRKARSLGIAIVEQQPELAERMTVAENVVLGAEPCALISRGKLNESVKAVGAEFGMEVEPSEKVAGLPLGHKQKVALLRALYRGADILLLDEPTAVLSPLEAEKLLEAIHKLRERGLTIILVSHRLDEVMSVADRVTVMRHGRDVGEFERSELSTERLVRAMFGKKLEEEPVVRRSHTTGDELLKVELSDSEFTVREGEIFCILGVPGNGQERLVDGLVGARRGVARMGLKGQDLRKLSPARRRELGLGYIASVNSLALLREMSVRDNLLLGNRVRWWLPSMRGWVRERLERFRVEPCEPGRTLGKLSGGNQQRTLLARELPREFSLLVADEPFKGLDLNSAREVKEELLRAVERGAGVLLLTSEIATAMELSDRITVIYRGRLSEPLERREFDMQVLSEMMLGGQPR